MRPDKRFTVPIFAVVICLLALGIAGSAGASMEYETTATTNQLDSSEVVFDWSTEGHDPSRSGYNKNSTGPKSDVDARWVYEADNSSPHEPAVVADGLVFVPTRDGLQVLNNETGVTVWNETEISVDHVSVSEGVAVTTSSFDSEIQAYDAMTGEEQWNVTNFDARNIVVSNGTIYVERYYLSQDYVRLYAFDLQTGTEQWSVQHADDVGGGLAADEDTVYATWKLSDGWNREYGVFALNASNGEESWRFETEGVIAMHPVVVDGNVYVGAGGEVVHDGEKYDPVMYALDARDGHVDWVYDAHARPNGAAVTGDTVYVSMGNGIHALDRATGERQWAHRMDGDIDYGLSYTRMLTNAPAVADGVVYATNDRGFVDALDATTGAVQWTYRVEGRATHPALADGRLYVHAPVTRDDDVVRVYALEEPPFAFSGLTPSTTSTTPGENVTVDVTVENVDDETRTYDLSLMADGVFANEWVAVDNASGQLMPGQSTTVTFETQFSTAGSWDLSIRRAAEREASIGPVTVDIDHSPSVDDWPIRGFNPGATDANGDTDGPTQHIQERWNVADFDDDTQPVVSNGSAFVIRDQYRSAQPNVYRLDAYDFASGTLQWNHNFTAENRKPVGSATVKDGTAYVYTTSRFLYDDAPDPTVGTVYAFDVADGSLQWSNDIPLNRTMTTDQAPIVANGIVYVAGAVSEQDNSNADASVYALDADTGGIEWHHTTGEDNALEEFYTLSYADDTLFATLNDETDPNTNDFVESVVAINATTGTQTWTQTSQDLDLNRHVVTNGGLVYVIDRQDNGNGWIAEEIVAYDATDGTETWRFVPPNVTTSSNEYDQWRLYKPVVTNDAVFVYQLETATNTYQRLNRVNASTGELEWRRSYHDGGSFVVVDGLVYSTDYNDKTTIYDAETGEELDSTDSSSSATGSVQTVINGTLFGTTDQGQTLRVLSEGGHFEFSDLAVASDRVGLGENATITATVTNVGDLERSWNANLLVSPDKDRQHHNIWNSPGRSGTLAPGESETITWSVLLNERGDYTFTIQPNYENSGMSAYLNDLTHGSTISVGDDRDDETIDFVGPREMPAGSDAWPKESYDAGNTGNNSGTAAPTTVGDDTVTWSVNHSYEWTSGPTLAKDTVFVGGNHVSGGAFVYAHNATDGALQWQYQSYGSSDVEVPPTYAGGYVYTATSDGRVYQFDAATGERLWTYNEFYNVGGITVVDDVAYVAGTYYQHSGYGGTLHALNASTREVLWTFDRASSSYGMEIKPAVVDGKVYVTSDDGYTYALDAETGVIEWSQAIAGTGSSLHSPIVENGVVYVDDTTWDSTDANLYALNATDGSIIWSTPANVDGDIGSSPALVNDTLFFTADGAVRAVDATGEESGGGELWSTPICSATRHSPVYAGGTVYLGTTDNAIQAYDADTGDLVWRYDAYGEYAFTPAVVDGVLYGTGLENTDGVYSLLAMEGGPTDEPKTTFDYSGLFVSNETVAVGESVTVSATVENQGDVACDYSADLVIDDTVEDTTTGSLGDGWDDTVEFTHSFDTTGTYNVTVEDLTPIEVTVTESVADPVISPTTRDFGDVDVGNSTDRYVQVTNEGTETLYLTDQSITGTDADAYSIISVSATTVYPENTATIWMRFEPGSDGPKTATLEVDTTEDTVTAALTGNGVSDPPAIQVTPTSVDFGDVTTGTTVNETMTIENVGGSTLTFDNATLGTSEVDSFEVVAGNTTTALGPGETHELTVEFAPLSAIVDSTTLRVYTDDPTNGTVDIDLSGTGVDDTTDDTDLPELKVAPLAIDFDSVELGSSATETITITNVGSGELNVTNITLSGSDTNSFTENGTAATLTSETSSIVNVTFTPTSTGVKTANLVIESNDPDGPSFTVAVSGETTSRTTRNSGSSSSRRSSSSQVDDDTDTPSQSSWSGNLDALGHTTVITQGSQKVRQVDVTMPGGSGQVTVSEITTLPDDVPEPDGASVVWLDISTSEPANGTATARLSVNRSVVEAANAVPENLRIRHYTNGEWETLQTTLVSVEGDIVLEATVSGFSPFAVTALEPIAPDVDGETSSDDDERTESNDESDTDDHETEEDDNNQSESEATTTEQTSEEAPGFGVLSALLALIVLSVLSTFQARQR